MKNILNATSTNGRWGLTVVSDSMPEGKKFPQPGTLTHAGRSEEHEIYIFDFIPRSQEWVLSGGDMEPLADAETVISVGVQPEKVTTLIVMGPQAVVKSYGYNRRSSRIIFYDRGRAKKCPSKLLKKIDSFSSSPQTDIVRREGIVNYIKNSASDARKEGRLCVRLI